MDGEVVYELSLKDGLTNKLHSANKAAHGLEHTMHQLGERVLHVAEAFGISFALFKGIEFVHESIEEFEKLHQAEAQIEAGLESTRHAAGMTGEALEESAIALSRGVRANQADIADMQSMILTFPKITKPVFEETQMAILDMSTRMHMGIKQATIMLGKAMQDPERGANAMRRAGVNFNKTQTEMLKHLVQTGHAAQAQKMILSELHTEFGGSAKAAFDADPLARFNKLTEELKINVGRLATSFLHDLTPALERVGIFFHDVFKWAKDNADIFKTIGVAAAIAGGGLLAYKGIMLGVIAVQKIASFWETVQLAGMYQLEAGYATASFGARMLAAAQYGLNAAFAANPIGFIITALAAVGAAVYYCYNHFQKFRAALWATWGVIKEFGSIVGDIFMGVYHAIHGAFKLDPKEVERGMLQQAGAIANAGMRLAHAAKEGWDAGMKDFAVEHSTAKGPEAPKGGDFKAPKADALAVKPETKGAKGNKVITINIHIGSLVKELQVKTVNMKEGAVKVQEMVAGALMNAVNQSQIIAEGS